MTKKVNVKRGEKAKETSKLRPLSPQQRIFCERYAETLNGVESYMFAYPNSKKESASASASRMLARDYIQKYLDDLFDAGTNHLLSSKQAKAQIVNKMWEIAFDPETPSNSQIQAVKMLAASHGVFGDKVEVTSKTIVARRVKVDEED